MPTVAADVWLGGGPVGPLCILQAQVGLEVYDLPNA